MECRLKDIVGVEKATINPQKSPNTTFLVYSLPGFDNDKTPESLDGANIFSNKILLNKSEYILFNKLNLKFKRVWLYKSNRQDGIKICSTEFIPLYIIQKDNILLDYLYYWVINDDFYCLLSGQASGTSNSHQRINKEDLLSKIVKIPDVKVQGKIVKILRALDNKIECNNRINKVIEKQTQILYRKLFVNTPNNIASVYRVGDYFDISIGKTPPRKEHQWFTTNPNDVAWVSISDMGKCGTFISDSSERLTAEAVKKFNIKVVPSNTILLSFKLTVGRVAITDGEMTTNEAIAHFKTAKPEITEYLYCYLRDFDYQTMGSTSSIATAVNSKTIKEMPFNVPTAEALRRFHAIAEPMFSQIKTNQAENKRLAEIRDLLLPRLMSGEFDVSSIEF